MSYALIALTNNIALEKSDERSVGVGAEKETDERSTVGERIGFGREEAHNALEFLSRLQFSGATCFAQSSSTGRLANWFLRLGRARDRSGAATPGLCERHNPRELVAGDGLRNGGVEQWVH